MRKLKENWANDCSRFSSAMSGYYFNRFRFKVRAKLLIDRMCFAGYTQTVPNLIYFDMQISVRPYFCQASK